MLIINQIHRFYDHFLAFIFKNHFQSSTASTPGAPEIVYFAVLTALTFIPESLKGGAMKIFKFEIL